MNNGIKAICDSLEMTEKSRKLLISALEEIWKQEEDNTKRKIRGLKIKLESVKGAIDSLMSAYLEESDIEMKQDIKERRNNKKMESLGRTRLEWSG